METNNISYSSNLLSTGASLYLSDGTAVSVDKQKSVLADTIANYNSSQGHIQIKNPGELVVLLEKPSDISYLRFLLWDNCGPTKQQPSRRRYTYRLLYTSKYEESGSRWTVVYENTQNPSNGWQEFYFENRRRRVSAIKIQCFQNTTPSAHKDSTQIVSIQAFADPTQSIMDMLELKHLHVKAAPPVPGIVKNRVIVGTSQENLKVLVQAEINMTIKKYIEDLKRDISDEEEMNNLSSVESELGKSEDNVLIDRQINLFYNSILRPVEEADARVKKKYAWITHITLLVAVVSFVKELVAFFA